ncbi:MAG TPA: hypothetical protein VN577_12935 [Terriglobales bacterium]|nr:hypothetical protein [Terriglobales bacterium]
MAGCRILGCAIFRSATIVCAALLLFPVFVPAQLQQGSSAPQPVRTEAPPDQPPTAALRTIFLEGLVLIDDPDWQKAATLRPLIQANCGGVRASNYAGDDGTFSLTVDMKQNMLHTQDVASGIGDIGLRGTPVREGFTTCELKAHLEGYISNVLEVYRAENRDPKGVGTLILSRVGAPKRNDGTVSVTTLSAPKKATKYYEEALKLAAKGDLDGAEGKLRSSVKEGATYALAWVALGEILERRNKLAEARDCYEKASAADQYFVIPYVRLAALAIRQQDWKQAVKWSQQAVANDSLQFPAAYLYGAVGHMNLREFDQAQKEALHGVFIDKRSKEPRLFLILAQIAYNTGNQAQEEQQLRTYLKLAPGAADADRLRARLSELESQHAAAGKSPENDQAK